MTAHQMLSNGPNKKPLVGPNDASGETFDTGTAPDLLAPVAPPQRPSLASNVLDTANDLSVCDITGDWGRYQWSLCLFAGVFSALSSIVVVWGPMFTPDMAHACRPEWANSTAGVEIPADRRECFVGAEALGEPLPGEPRQLVAVKCTSFLYNELGHGLMLTNGFDLVCERRWLRSLVYSSALTGMLISSVTLGVFSDKFGRLRCVQVGFAISCLANVGCILARDYFLLCACVALMGFAQIGSANALCTLLMEATSPRFRYVPIFQYGAGWALGTMLLPALNALTRDYRLLMGLVLAGQLLMLPWLRWGVFESIRWLLSEGHLNRAQIELRRACRINQVQTDTQLAQSIARIEMQQVRRASRIIEDEHAPGLLSHALGAKTDETSRELDLLSSAIRKSLFGLESEGEARQFDSVSLRSDCADQQRRADPPAELSPTLSRMSFNLPPIIVVPAEGQKAASAGASCGPPPGHRRDSLSTQALIQLAMKYSKTIEGEEQGQCVILQLFHSKLWRQSLVLLLVSVVFETSYYGLVQTNKFVGASVAANYVTGALGDLLAAFFSCLLLAFASRKSSLIGLTLFGSLICLGMALSYQLVPDLPAGAAPAREPLEPDQPQPLIIATNWTLNDSTLASLQPPLDNLSPLELPEAPAVHFIDEDPADATQASDVPPLKVLAAAATAGLSRASLLKLRQNITFYLMVLGKFTFSTGILVAATVAMETYPNNLRQTGMGAIIFTGRMGSIMAPFLFDDTNHEKVMFKLTLTVLAGIGLFVCLLIPVTLRDQRNKELCDQLDEVE